MTNPSGQSVRRIGLGWVSPRRRAARGHGNEGRAHAEGERG
jgi:hypothetical protein